MKPWMRLRRWRLPEDDRLTWSVQMNCTALVIFCIIWYLSLFTLSVLKAMLSGCWLSSMLRKQFRGLRKTVVHADGRWWLHWCTEVPLMHWWWKLHGWCCYVTPLLNVFWPCFDGVCYSFIRGSVVKARDFDTGDLASIATESCDG